MNDSICRCDLCDEPSSEFRVIHYFERFELFACSICTYCSLGYSIPYPLERRFEVHISKFGKDRPRLNDEGLYALTGIDIWDASECFERYFGR